MLTVTYQYLVYAYIVKATFNQSRPLSDSLNCNSKTDLILNYRLLILRQTLLE